MNITDSSSTPPESPAATEGTVWYDSETGIVTLWLNESTDTGVVSEDTPDAVDALLARKGWARGSGFAFAADSDTVRYADIIPLTDPAPTGDAYASSTTSPTDADR